jgi:hypothetical protein
MAVERVRKVAALLSASKPDALAAHVVDHDGVRAFGEQLGAAVFHAVFGLGGKADDELAGTAAADHLGQNVLRGRQFQGERPAALELLLGDGDGAVVGHGGGLDDQRGLGHALQHGLRASARRW